MSQRREFVELAQAEGTNKRGLCRRFGRGGLVCLNSAARFDKWNRAAVR